MATHQESPLLKTLFGLGTLSATTSALMLLYSIFAARLMGPEEFARFGAAIALLGVMQGVFGPLHNLTVRYSARQLAQGKPEMAYAGYRQYRRMAIWLAAGTVLLLLVAYPFLKTSFPHLSNSLWILMGGVILLTLPKQVTLGLFRGAQDYRPFAATQITEAAIRLSLGVSLLWAVSPTAELGVAAYFTGTLLAAAVAYLLQRSYRPHSTLPAVPFADQWVGLQPLLLLAIAGAGLQQSSGLVAQRTLSPVEAGAFFAALNLSRALLLLMQPILLHTLPSITKLHTQGISPHTRLVKMMLVYCLLSLPLLAACALFPEQIITLIFSSTYLAASPLLLPISAAFLFLALCHLVALGSIACNQSLPAWIYAAGLLVLLILFSAWNQSGMALATTLLRLASGLFLVMLGTWLLGVKHRPQV